MPPGRHNGYAVQANSHIMSGASVLDTLSQCPTHGLYHDNTLSAHHYATGQSIALPRLPSRHSAPSSRHEPSQHLNTPPILRTEHPIQPYVSESVTDWRYYYDSQSKASIVPFARREGFGGTFIPYARVYIPRVIR